ncbi:unnamed protein product [Brassicogethes aeneus]|uniref:THAP-type domain-containing protein n=1 Tax=Brassicogethes aeneus TaxID=1431903 RepID=A0A9P0FDT8_BRAAE|nr:unnamed protein product [Brassicogethes aeneus]
MVVAKKSKRLYSCVANYCKNNSVNYKGTFFKFPSNVNRTKQWISVCGFNTDINIQNKRICDIHFTSEMFRNTIRPLLNNKAIPIIFPSDINTSFTTNNIGIPDTTSTGVINDHKTIVDQDKPICGNNELIMPKESDISFDNSVSNEVDMQLLNARKATLLEQFLSIMNSIDTEEELEVIEKFIESLQSKLDAMRRGECVSDEEEKCPMDLEVVLVKEEPLDRENEDFRSI